MHIPDGFLSLEVNVAGYLVSAIVVGIALAKAKKSGEERMVPLMGVTSAFVFAAQMLNFPIAGGTSGHFLGAMLSAVLMGPLNACLIMTLVLIVQCLGFADGGLTALGCNIFNMGVVGSVCGYYTFRWLKALLPRKRTMFLLAVSVGAWLSLVLAAGTCALELALSGTSPIGLVFPAMVVVHSLIGIGEAIITASVISLVLVYRPDLVKDWDIGLVASRKRGGL